VSKLERQIVVKTLEGEVEPLNRDADISEGELQESETVRRGNVYFFCVKRVGAKKRRAAVARCSSAGVSDLTRQPYLLQNCEVAGVGGRWSTLPGRGLSSDHGIFIRAEVTNARLVEDLR
jgi:hypothetical protein